MRRRPALMIQIIRILFRPVRKMKNRTKPSRPANLSKSSCALDLCDKYCTLEEGKGRIAREREIERVDQSSDEKHSLFRVHLQKGTQKCLCVCKGGMQPFIAP